MKISLHPRSLRNFLRHFSQSRGSVKSLTGHTTKLLVAVVICLVTLVADGARAQDDEEATFRAALVALYHATDGPNWKNNQFWLSDLPVSTWYGVGGSNYPGALYLSDNGLKGSLPPEFALPRYPYFDGAHSRFPGHALTPTGVMAIRCKQFHLPDL